MGLLGDYLPDWLPDDPNQKAAARAGLLNFGAALMGGRGNLGQILGGGLMAGSQGYAGSLDSQQKQALQAAQTNHYGLETKKLQNEIDEPMNLQRIINGGPAPVTSPSSLPSLPGRPPSAVSALARGMPMAQPVPQQAPAVDASIDGAPESAPLPAESAPDAPRATLPVTGLPQVGQAATASPNLFAAYQAIGDRLTNAGKPAAAKQYYELAEKMRPKYATEFRAAMGSDGKLHNYLVAEDGTLKDAGVGVKPDMKATDVGGKIIMNDMNAMTSGQSFDKSATPGELLSNATQIRGQNMTDARAGEANQNARGVIIQTDTGPMLANTKTGATQQIIGPDGKPVTRTKALTEFQGKSAAFGDRAMAADKILSELGTNYSPAAINSKNAVEGTPLIGGAMGAITNKFALSENDQRAEQAQRDFINATLRQESGAAIGANEFDNARKQYFPQPGDTKKVREQKAANRKLVIEGFKRSAGSNAEFTPVVESNLPTGWSVEVH